MSMIKIQLPPKVHTIIKLSLIHILKNSLVASGSIINGTVENSILFKKTFVGNNCVIKNSIILNDVYLGDNTYIENCIVESRNTIRANTRYIGEDGVKVVVEKNERYAL